MINEHEVIGYTTADLVAAMLDAGIHTSVDKFRRLASEIQRRALASRNANEETEPSLASLITQEVASGED